MYIVESKYWHSVVIWYDLSLVYITALKYVELKGSSKKPFFAIYRNSLLILLSIYIEAYDD